MRAVGHRWILVALTAVAVGLVAPAAAGARAVGVDWPIRRTASGAPSVQPEVLRGLRDDGRADVLILLRDGAADDAPGSILAEAAADAQTSVLATLAGSGFVLRTRYDVLPLLAGTITAEGLARLDGHPLVEAVEADGWMWPVGTFPGTDRRGGGALHMAEAVPVVGADFVHRQYGLRGEGVTVAVLDTGIDNEHPDFEGRIIDQYCYSSSRSCAPNDIVEGPNAQDEAGHGTAVSGIIASAGKESAVGVAPEANIVAVRVFRDAGGAQTSDIIKGLDFVLRKQPQHDTRVVNMSLGGGAGRGVNCDDQNRSMKEAFQRLVARKVTIMVATGNNGFPDEVSSPGCISNSTAVGATYDGEYPTGGGWCPSQRDVTPLTIACFTNRGRAMDLLAPGLFIRSSRLGGGVTNPGAGTSYASPIAAGVAALMLQADPDLRASDVERTLQRTGTDVKHLENSDIFKLVDARRAVEAVLPATPIPTSTSTPAATATSTMRPTDPAATATSTATEPTESATPEPTRTVGTPSTPATTPTVAGPPIFLPAVRNR